MKTTSLYTCPMHPEIEQDRPGHCPICGMDLEPKGGRAHQHEDEGNGMVLKLIVSSLLLIPLLLISMGPWVAPPLSYFLQFVLSLPIVFWAGSSFFQRGWQSFRSRNLNMFLLLLSELLQLL